MHKFTRRSKWVDCYPENCEIKWFMASPSLTDDEIIAAMDKAAHDYPMPPNKAINPTPESGPLEQPSKVE